MLKELQPTETTPSARRFHSAIYVPDNHSMLIFGGLGPTLSLVIAESYSGSTVRSFPFAKATKSNLVSA